MPIYEYRCTQCGVRYEKLVPTMKALPPPCPSCHSGAVEKLFSVPSVNTGGGSSAALGPCGSPKSSCGSGGFS